MSTESKYTAFCGIVEMGWGLHFYYLIFGIFYLGIIQNLHPDCMDYVTIYFTMCIISETFLKRAVYSRSINNENRLLFVL